MSACDWSGAPRGCLELEPQSDNLYHLKVRHVFPLRSDVCNPTSSISSSVSSSLFSSQYSLNAKRHFILFRSRKLKRWLTRTHNSYLLTPHVIPANINHGAIPPRLQRQLSTQHFLLVLNLLLGTLTLLLQMPKHDSRQLSHTYKTMYSCVMKEKNLHHVVSCCKRS